MSYFEEFGFCPIQEYEAWEPYRVSPDDILVDEKYIVMMQLQRQLQNHRAIRVPTRAKKVEKISDGVHVVKFKLEIDALKETSANVESEMRNDYMSTIVSSTTRGPIVFKGVPVRQAYFRGHLDKPSGPDDELRRMLDQEVSAGV